MTTRCYLVTVDHEDDEHTRPGFLEGLLSRHYDTVRVDS